MQRLRIYPHALREQNAYYDPIKKALLFGYFPARPELAAGGMPGGMTFSCLSHDIIAHEMSHALLDGMARGLTSPTNVDMLAFHEAFADLVALFQHFSLPGVLNDQLSRTRGSLRRSSRRRSSPEPRESRSPLIQTRSGFRSAVHSTARSS